MVGVDQPMKAPSMKIQTPYWGKNCLSYHSCHFVKNSTKFAGGITAIILSKKIILNQTPSCIWSMCLHCIGKVSICPSKAVVGVDRPIKSSIYAYTNTLLGNNCLSSHSCHFVKKEKKINKQCLLDTPRTVRASEKTWQVIVQTSRP